MFLTLFPFGTGDFEDLEQTTPISFASHANMLFDVPRHIFCYHHSYVFVVFNIIQHRRAHFQTHFVVQNNKFETVARQLTSVSPDILLLLSQCLQKETKISNLTNQEQSALELFHQVNTVWRKIPGSQGSKILT